MKEREITVHLNVFSVWKIFFCSKCLELQEMTFFLRTEAFL